MSSRDPLVLPAPFDLTGRTAVVTGGSAGIGFGIAAALGRAGASVAIWARDEARLERAATALGDAGIVAETARCDVTDEDAVAAAMAHTVERLGDPDILVANAGLAPERVALVDTSLATWEASIRGNLTATFLCFRSAAERMIARGTGGALVAVTSAASVQSSPLIHHYAAAKAGLHALVRALAHELAPARIRCNALVPGFTESDRIRAAEMPARRLAEVVASIPAGRIGHPSDLGAAAVYLADPSLSYQTGATLFVDGGLSIMAAQQAASAAWDAALATPPDVR